MRHRPVPRRPIAALSAAGVAAAFGLTAAALSTTAHAAAAPAALAYHVGSAGSDMVEPWLTVTNTGSAALDLSTVKIRYYFTIDSAPSYQFTCEWAQIGCGNITGAIGTLPTPTATADHYLEVGFTGGSLAPGASTGDLQLRMNAAGWAPVDQADDYSFNASQTSYGATNTITLAVGGTIVSGTAPGGNPPPTSPSSSPSTSSSSGGGGTPNGALFDDFSYTGPADPNLAAHGWAIRTGAGGPGVQNSWAADTFSFPSDSTAQGGHVMDLTASTDGTTSGTKQAEIDTTQEKFFQGTYAARVYFNDAPTTGTNGDHVNETFYTIPRTTPCTAKTTSNTCPTAAGAARRTRCTPPPGTAPTPRTASPPTPPAAFRAGTPWSPPSTAAPSPTTSTASRCSAAPASTTRARP